MNQPAGARDAWKQAAADAAVELVVDGMVVGLGTGSTAKLAIARLGERVGTGLRIVGIPTSERSAAQARELGIPLTTFAQHPRIDITIDGADEVELGSLNLIKGLGGALLREKIVAAASERLVIVADGYKLVERLGARTPVPVEVVPFGWEVTAMRIRALGGEPEVRRIAGGEPFVTDGGHFILDCQFRLIGDASLLEERLANTVGIVESGLFIDLATEILIADQSGVHRMIAEN